LSGRGDLSAVIPANPLAPDAARKVALVHIVDKNSTIPSTPEEDGTTSTPEAAAGHHREAADDSHS